MSSRLTALRGTVMLALVSCLATPIGGQAQTMDQYYAVPPFVADQVAPNIILVLDNSGSMSGLTCDRNDDGYLSILVWNNCRRQRLLGEGQGWTEHRDKSHGKHKDGDQGRNLTSRDIRM